MAATVVEGSEPALDLALFRTLIESAPEGVIVWAPNRRVVFVNAAFERMLGLRPQSLAEWQAAYPCTARTALETEMLASLSSSGAWGGVLDARGADGERVPLSHRAGVLRDGQGKIAFHYCYLRDLSRQRALEQEAARAREAAQQANHAKTRFLAAASHDIRQPLQAMGMFVAVLANGEHSAANRKLIDRIQESLSATEQLLSSLLDVSKLEAGVVEPSVGSFPVADLLERLRAEFEPVARAAGLRFHVVSSRIGLRADQALLERLLRHLLANAVRYTETGGVVLGCRRRGDQLRIEVWDSGSGIPEDQIPAIFREFHQLGNPSRDRRQGLGLGLAIVDRLAKLLEHPVYVRSTLHKGSVFAVEVPLAEPLAPKRPVQLDLAIGGRDGGLIALIDDEPDVLESMSLFLESWGHTVVAAASCDELVDRLAELRQIPDVMIADYRLRNGTTGGQAIARLRVSLNANMPAIIVTGDTAPERLRMATANGHSLLHKPVQPAQLKAAIDELLAPRRQPRPGKHANEVAANRY